MGLDTPDDDALRADEKREWGKLRKRLQRDEAQYHSFTVSRPEGVTRPIFGSAPLYEAQAALPDPEEVLLEVLRHTTSLPLPALDDAGEMTDPAPYRKRPAHGGPAKDDPWALKKTVTRKWVVVGSRPGRALAEENQNIHDEAVAAQAGVRTWNAGAT